MSNLRVSTALATLGVGVALLSAPAMASETDELRQQVRQLMDRIEQLEATQQREAVEAEAEAAKRKEAESKYVTAGDMPNSFKLPGTNTSFRFTGYAKLSALYDIGPSTGDLFSPAIIPLDGTAASERRGVSRIHARESRLGLTALHPTDQGPLRIVVEGDFFGEGGAELYSHGSGFRLRHAYGEWNGFLLGQTWTSVYDPFSPPETVDFNGPVGNFGSVTRVPMIRYTAPLDDGNTIVVALENPESEFTGDTAVDNSTHTDTGFLASVNLDHVPDLIARFDMKRDWGGFSVKTVLREITADDGANRKDSEFAYMLGYGWAYYTNGKSRIYNQGFWGRGAGRYGSLGGLAAYFDGDKLHLQEEWGGTVGYQHYFSDSLRSSIIGGYIHSDSKTDELPGSANKEIITFHANMIWNPIPSVEIGGEYMYGYRQVQDGREGDAHRLMFATTYRF